MKHAIGMRWVTNQNQGLRHFPHHVGIHMNILLITKVKILCEHVGPPIILAIELRVVTII